MAAIDRRRRALRLSRGDGARGDEARGDEDNQFALHGSDRDLNAATARATDRAKRLATSARASASSAAAKLVEKPPGLASQPSA
jgi:hypothetical protein